MRTSTLALLALVPLAWGCSAASRAPGGAAPAFPSTPPALGPAPTLTLPVPERRRLANGLEVVYVRHGSLPVVHATLVTRGGTSDDPAELPGLATFVADMLDEGAGGRDALELSGALDLLGASLRTDAGWDAANVDLHVLRDRLPEALGLMADVATRPDFPEAEVRRQREERLTDLRRARDAAGTIAGNAFAALVFGAEHPYGRLATQAATARMERADLARFHRAFYRPAHSTLILVGAVDAAALHPVVERAFGEWQGEAAPPPVAPAAPVPGATRIFLIDRPGSAQSEIRIGHPGVARDNPDYFPLLVLNTVLGGSFTSRLNTNLREQHGFSYGARSVFGMRRGPGPFVASSAVFTAKTDSAVVEFFREIHRIRDESVPADELERAKNYLALGLPRRFETTRDVAAQLAELETYGLSLDHYNEYVQRVLSVDAADLRRVARAYLHPERSVVVVVGDREKIQAGLEALPIGSLELREVEEFVR